MGDVMNISLKELSENDGKQIYDMLQGIEKNDNGFNNRVKDMPYENFHTWLKENAGYSKGIGLADWMVPQTTYWLYCDEKPVGCGRIRHYLNENLKKDGGHIGYAITSSCRGNGYGNKILELLLVECKKMQIGEIQIGANKDNERSNKIIRRNGGVLFRETETKNQYIINLQK
jgi:predicted acetyltransferase